MKLKFKVISCEKMHMISIRVRYGFRWHSDKPYRTRLRLVRHDLSEWHLNPYRTRMDTICISCWTNSCHLRCQSVLPNCVVITLEYKPPQNYLYTQCYIGFYQVVYKCLQSAIIFYSKYWLLYLSYWRKRNVYFREM